MRSSLTNILPVLMASALLPGYACKSDGGLADSGSGGDSQTARGGSATGKGSGGTSGAGGTGALGDAGSAETYCSCAGGTTTWACYCHVFDCGKTIDAYLTDGGSSYDTMIDYANCNLVVFERSNSVDGLTDVFDRTTGQLVGQSRCDNAMPSNNCPFGSIDAPIRSLAAGRLPDSTCVRSKCVVTSGANDMCAPIDAGSTRRD
jgi:hypothetical protein